MSEKYSIEFDHLTKTFGNHTVLNDMSFKNS